MAIEAQDMDSSIEIHPVGHTLMDTKGNMLIDNSTLRIATCPTVPLILQTKLRMLSKISLLGCDLLRYMVSLIGMQFSEPSHGSIALPNGVSSIADHQNCGATCWSCAEGTLRKAW